MRGMETILDRTDLLEDWDYAKNGALLPGMVSMHSGKNVWWKCRIGHSWEATPANRCHGTGCPYCANKKVMAGYNDLKTKAPGRADQWDYDKNAGLLPEAVTLNYGKKVWWICPEGHSYEATPANRNHGTGCPYCAGRKVLEGFNDLKSQDPEVASQWDYEKNGDLRPEMVTQFSKHRIWWICKEGHSWQTAVQNRHDTGCPVCSGRIAQSGVNDLVTICPELAAEWDYKKNTNCRPEEMRPGSNIPVWWICGLGHSWKISPNHRIRGSGCPYCANKKVLAGFNDLKTMFPEVASQWDYEKNGSLKPEMVISHSNRKVWWCCARGHSWQGSVSNRTLHKRGCPYCAGQRAIAGENDLATLDPVLASEWDYDKNGELRPDNVMPGSQKKVWWKCAEGHSWRAAIYSRKNHGCPVCSGRQAIPGINDLKTTIPEIAVKWDYEKNGDLRPEDVTAQSNRDIWWKCRNGHSWKSKPSDRYRGNGCPKCDGRIRMRTHFM